MSALDPAQWLLLFVIGLAVLLVLRVPVGLALLIVSLGGAMLLYGTLPGVEMTIVSMVSGLATFTLTAIPMFILMGELFFRSGIAYDAIRVVDRLLRRLPGRLAFISVGMGALLGVLSGSVMASTAMLGGTLAPQMMKRGYSHRLALGSILGSGGLAMILPPSTVVIVWGATAGVPVGPLLMAGIIPGILMALGYTIVVGVWAYFFGGAESKRRIGAKAVRAASGETSPLADDSPTPAWRSIASLLGMLLVIFGVLLLILLGIATPTEAAAIAVVATALLLLVLGRLNMAVVTTAFRKTLASTGMIFLIIGAAAIYGKVLAGSGSVTAFVTFMTSLTDNAYLLILVMLLIVVILGLFLESIAIVLLTIPLFMPIVSAAGIDPIWFGMIMIIAIQVGTVTPPFGMSLFVIRQYAPKSLKMSEIYKSAIPFVISDLSVIGLLLAVPALVTFIPNLM